MPSRMSLDDLAALLGVELDDEVDTVGGLLAERLGLVPIPGASIVVAGHRLIAESAGGRRNRITSVLVVPEVMDQESDEQASGAGRADG